MEKKTHKNYVENGQNVCTKRNENEEWKNSKVKLNVRMHWINEMYASENVKTEKKWQLMVACFLWNDFLQKHRHYYFVVFGFWFYEVAKLFQFYLPLIFIKFSVCLSVFDYYAW